ncbi:hypothetical protein [Comamonas kerstersii]|uniref:hypothetical protein n=1 Tax=Comamonas kerstersii TaxID=225992 RepID=UPI0013B05320|nr:hypothetical protein [Comamonas kerstersii]
MSEWISIVIRLFLGAATACITVRPACHREATYKKKMPLHPFKTINAAENKKRCKSIY